MKILHCSDLHLDASLRGRLDGNAAAGRRRELLHTFHRLMDWAGAHAADAILLCGDLFDSSHPSRQTVRAVEDLIASHGDLSVFYLRGNHDEGDLLFSGRPDPANLFRFDSSWTSYVIPLGSSGQIRGGQRRSLCITGMELAGGIPGGQGGNGVPFSAPQLDPSCVNIVMLHGQVLEGAVPSGPDSIPLGPLRGCHIDYLALGHIHSHRAWALDQRGTAVYAGCLEGRGFDECGACGFYLLDINEETGAIRYEFIPFAGRRLFSLPCDITGCASAVDLCSRADAVLRAAHSSDALAAGGIGEQDLVRLELTGRPEYDCPTDPAYLVSEFADRFYYFTVTDHTRPMIRAGDYLSDPTLKGEFVRTVMGAPDLSAQDKDEILCCGLRALSLDTLF